MKILFKKCTLDDLAALQALSRHTYDVTFRHLNTPETMAAYLDTAFDIEKLRGELQNPGSNFYFLYAEGKLAGYIKLNEPGSQTDINDPSCLELERIYVTPEFQGHGLGHVLMEKAAESAVQRKKAYIWLGVWEKNEKAIAFYKKHGFDVIGTHTFVMGDEAQTDFVMRKDLL